MKQRLKIGNEVIVRGKTYVATETDIENFLSCFVCDLKNKIKCVATKKASCNPKDFQKNAIVHYKLKQK